MFSSFLKTFLKLTNHDQELGGLDPQLSQKTSLRASVRRDDDACRARERSTRTGFVASIADGASDGGSDGGAREAVRARELVSRVCWSTVFWLELELASFA